ncbi:MAG: glycosyltransferase [Myxococcaceae bacterium]
MRHVAEQLTSLRKQQLEDWTLLVRDDGSTDGTVEQLAALARLDPRVHLLPPGGRAPRGRWQLRRADGRGCLRGR